jgi:hypothetical protein
MAGTAGWRLAALVAPTCRRNTTMRLVLVPFVLFLVLQQFAVLRLTQSCRTHLLPVCHGPMLIDLDAHADASEPTAEPVVLTMLDNTEERWKLDDQVQPNATARGCRLCHAKASRHL